jgi:phospholipase/carboxylesterase
MSFTYLSEPGSPTLVMLHGTGGTETEMLIWGRSLLPGAGIVAPRGNEPEHGMNRWFRRLREGVFDEPNLIARANELSDWLIENVPGPRIAVGFSNGANIAAVQLLLRPETYAAAALLAPMVPLTPTDLPDLSGKPVLMVCGEQDPMVPRFNAQTLATMLETSGADLELVWHPGGHGLGQAEENQLRHWLVRIKNGL